MPSKAIEALVDGDLSYRDRIVAHNRSRGKIALSDKDIEIWERAEKTQGILQVYRHDLGGAKNAIKKAFNLTHRMEVDRMIEDAIYLFGANLTMRKDYQRFMQWQDIEWALKIAKDKKDLDAFERLLVRREKLFQLAEADQVDGFVYFEVVVFHVEFKPELFEKHLAPDWKERAEKIKTDAMKEIGLLTDEDVEDAKFEEVTD